MPCPQHIAECRDELPGRRSKIPYREWEHTAFGNRQVRRDHEGNDAIGPRALADSLLLETSIPSSWSVILLAPARHRSKVQGRRSTTDPTAIALAIRRLPRIWTNRRSYKTQDFKLGNHVGRQSGTVTKQESNQRLWQLIADLTDVKRNLNVCEQSLGQHRDRLLRISEAVGGHTG